jgi:phosphoribosylanthranilate isomerase
MVKVKFCGLSLPEHIEWVNELKPDYIGFVFAKSKRQVSLEQALKLKSMLSPGIKAVGVFTDQSEKQVQEIVESGAIDLVQLHNFQIIKSPTVSNENAEFYLFDAPVPGSGKTFDWNLLKDKEFDKPFFLAGGLNPNNIEQAIKQVKPYGIDMSSGIETDGKKDFELMKKVIEVVKLK